MTNIRSSGFDNPAQLREHLEELEDEYDDYGERSSAPQADLQDHISQLRAEVRDLQRLVADSQGRLRRASEAQRDDRFWLQLASAVAATFVLSAAVKYFRLGPAGAAAVPLIASKISGRP